MVRSKKEYIVKVTFSQNLVDPTAAFINIIPENEFEKSFMDAFVEGRLRVGVCNRTISVSSNYPQVIADKHMEKLK